MTVKTFRNICSFRVFVPEKSGWIGYRPSLMDPNIWHCEFRSQDGKERKHRLIGADYAENVWDRFRSNEHCETTFVSGEYGPA